MSISCTKKLMFAMVLNQNPLVFHDFSFSSILEMITFLRSFLYYFPYEFMYLTLMFYHTNVYIMCTYVYLLGIGCFKC